MAGRGTKQGRVRGRVPMGRRRRGRWRRGGRETAWLITYWVGMGLLDFTGIRVGSGGWMIPRPDGGWLVWEQSMEFGGCFLTYYMETASYLGRTEAMAASAGQVWKMVVELVLVQRCIKLPIQDEVPPASRWLSLISSWLALCNPGRSRQHGIHKKHVKTHRTPTHGSDTDDHVSSTEYMSTDIAGAEMWFSPEPS